MSEICFKDFYTPTPYNNETKNQIWMSQIADSHDNHCNCNYPFCHLLASIFPPGHKDRDLTINQILLRDYTEKCLSGGEDATRDGLADIDIKEDPTKREEEDLGEKELDGLLAEAAAAAESTR